MKKEIRDAIEEGLKTYLWFESDFDETGRPKCCECLEPLTDEEILDGSNICDICALKMEG